MNEHALASGLILRGWKCGGTAEAAQQRLGVTEPFRGPLFDDMFHDASGEEIVTIPMEPLGVKGVEIEFGLVLSSDLPPRDKEYTQREVFDAVNEVMPIIEVCASRFASPVPASWIIADSANAGAIVHSKPKPLPLVDLIGSGATLFVNGEKTAEGVGQAVLGSPIRALLWLANKVRTGDHGLKAGTVISTGAMAGITPVKAGDRVECF